LESGHLYRVVLWKREKLTQAEEVLESISGLRKEVIGPDAVQTLDSLLQYGNALLEQDDLNKRKKAESVFSESWKFRDLASIRSQQAAYETVLFIEYYLAYTLQKMEQYADALNVMEDVYDRKEQLDLDTLPDGENKVVKFVENKPEVEPIRKTRKRRPKESEKISIGIAALLRGRKKGSNKS